MKLTMEEIRKKLLETPDPNQDFSLPAEYILLQENYRKYNIDIEAITKQLEAERYLHKRNKTLDLFYEKYKVETSCYGHDASLYDLWDHGCEIVYTQCLYHLRKDNKSIPITVFIGFEYTGDDDLHNSVTKWIHNGKNTIEVYEAIKDLDLYTLEWNFTLDMILNK